VAFDRSRCTSDADALSNGPHRVFDGFITARRNVYLTFRPSTPPRHASDDNARKIRSRFTVLGEYPWYVF